MALTPTMRGILAMVATSFFLIINDTLVKIASEELGTGQIIIIRGVMATLGISVFAIATGGLKYFRRSFSRPILVRGLGEGLAAITYLVALFNMPIGNITSIFQATPLAITAAGAILLGEAVGWRRWTAVAIGFVGVMIVARPDANGFNVYTLLVFACVLTVVMRDLATRRIDLAVPGAMVTAVSAFMVTLSGLVFLPFETWQPVSARAFWLLAASSVVLVISYMLIIVAVRRAPLSTVAPFRYSSIPFAIVAGYLVWGDVPDALTVLGILVIVGSGLYAFYRERQVGRAIAARGDLQPTR